MLFETDFLSLLQARLSDVCPVFFQRARQGTAEPFAVLQTIAVPGAIEVGVQRPWMQLDVYGATEFEAVTVAEQVMDAIQFHSGRTGETLFEHIKAERSRMIECEDGTWKVPIDIRFYCRRVQ
ncbi:MAG: hypothetical protein IJS84_00125 [Spirochaetales bacterium]|nr:hypothetical protein [Spirochaetales bacterium]MBQ7643416.1 hypothetical protein [Spirochaetales bacterium]